MAELAPGRNDTVSNDVLHRWMMSSWATYEVVGIEDGVVADLLALDTDEGVLAAGDTLLELQLLHCGRGEDGGRSCELCYTRFPSCLAMAFSISHME